MEMQFRSIINLFWCCPVSFVTWLWLIFRVFTRAKNSSLFSNLTSIGVRLMCSSVRANDASLFFDVNVVLYPDGATRVTHLHHFESSFCKIWFQFSFPNDEYSSLNDLRKFTFSAVCETSILHCNENNVAFSGLLDYFNFYDQRINSHIVVHIAASLPYFHFAYQSSPNNCLSVSHCLIDRWACPISCTIAIIYRQIYETFFQHTRSNVDLFANNCELFIKVCFR